MIRFRRHEKTAVYCTAVVGRYVCYRRGKRTASDRFRKRRDNLNTQLRLWSICLASLIKIPRVRNKRAVAITVLRRLSFDTAGRWNRVRICLVCDIPCSNLRIMSPLFCGNGPYPRSSLTYRTCLHYKPPNPVCQYILRKKFIFLYNLCDFVRY